ncbi:hypothetical protein HanXRQr2_Chr08g0330451 [Helianthus annuus]|uniref:Uncharacterized protein n=1 Tax=Helianthus annuus TaxID=4232 RepID=A0A9K3ID38_HELAN|nr:hypothetical protein HanXRQr2_Chr08g0330451 [Helianthus annuus]
MIPVRNRATKGSEKGLRVCGLYFSFCSCFLINLVFICRACYRIKYTNSSLAQWLQ